jgi:hypothetical protein
MLVIDSKGLMRMADSFSRVAKVAANLLVAAGLLAMPSVRATETILVGADSEWRYYNVATPPPEDWKAPAFNADAWKVGHAQLGYGDGDEATVIDGGALSPHPVTAYFRKSFSTDTPGVFSSLIFRLLRDDGAVVYVNGVEVIRSNMPDGAITPDTLAVTTVGATDTENTFIPYNVPASVLVTGQNVIAVEVHQVNVSSSDVSFALQVIGVSGSTSPWPVVSIAATQTETREPDAVTSAGPGKLLVHRTGSLDAMLPVYLRYDGTATAEADYVALPTRVEIPAGQESLELAVQAKGDYIKEPTETVVVKISEPPTSPDSMPYNIDPANGMATVSINDSRAGIEITAPGNGATFNAGSVIAIQAVAVAPGGTIPTVRFYDGDTLIGTSTPIFVTPPAPGTAITHRVEWQNAGAGDHVITARGAFVPELGDAGPIYISQKITIHVVAPPPPPLPVISIEATTAVTSEPLPNALVAPGVFTLRRSAPTDTTFAVWVGLGGTATSGVDYETPPTIVEFAAGQTEAAIKVLPKSDDLIEGDETVVAELTQPSTAGAVMRYTINPDKRRAVITIKDEDSLAHARIEITSPKNGDTLAAGTTIVVKATAVDPDGYIPRVEFFSDGVSIGVSEINFVQAPDPGTPIEHAIEWHNIPAGEHILTAKGARANGEIVTSPGVKVYVAPIDPPPPTVVSIHKLEDPTERPIPNADYASEFFEIRRNGPTNNDLQVFFLVPQDGEHIATPDVDYHALKSPITIPAGEFAAYMRVDAIDDTLVEGPEIVRVTLIPVPAMVNGAAVPSYTIDPGAASADVTIMDNDQAPQQTVLTVEVADGVATEVTTTDAIDTAKFVIRRVSGPLDVPVNVNFNLSGTALNGVDYKEVALHVQIPAGIERVGVEIVPIPDNLAEGEETVILTILLPPCAFPGIAPDCYLVDEHGSGRAVILDRRDDAPGVKILHPLNGAVFDLGAAVEIEAQAFDREGIISKLEVLGDGKSLASVTSDHIVTRWPNAAVGAHSIVAVATDGSGQQARSEIHILVRDANASAFVFRKLPPAYTPGTAFTVELRAEPPAGARAYAVEDHPPTGWTVSEISNDGVFDPATGKVKFGPFTEITARTLTYRVTPPGSATGRKEFAGVGSVDGVNYPIGGDRLIEQGPTEHPADTDLNFSINVAEVTAYTALWKRGDSIPLSYVTRAGYIWKHGEAYKFDGSHEPPFCWVPLQAAGDMLVAASAPESERVGSGATQPGVSANFELRITPPSGTSAYAIEEKIPAGWGASNVSNDGSFDAEAGVIRWGVFFDATARTFSYTLTPPPAVTAVARMEGRVSFDGVVYEIRGSGEVVSTDPNARPLLAKCEADASGKVHLELTGAAGQVGVLQTSSDLVHWQDVTTLYLPDGTVQFDDNASAAATVRYYRMQVR